MKWSPSSKHLLGLLASLLCSPLLAQRLVAYVPTVESTSSGVIMTSGSKDFLGDSSSVSSFASRQAHVTLSRGGSMLVCQASTVHLNAAFNPLRPAKEVYDPLLIALDRGGLELQMPMIASDTLFVGGMRFSSTSRPGKPAPLDIAVSLKPNGDTCVENRGKKSPALSIMDAFGHDPYILKAGDHILFEHGLVQESAAHETTSCGCPPPPPPGLSLADAAIQGRAGDKPTFDPAGSGFPFPASSTPEASSNTQPEAAPAAVQVAGTLVYDPTMPEPPLETNRNSPAGAAFPEPTPGALASLDPNPQPTQPAGPAGRKKLAFLPAPSATQTLAAAPSPPPLVPPERKVPYKQTLSTPAPVLKEKPGLLHSLGRFFKGMVNP